MFIRSAMVVVTGFGKARRVDSGAERMEERARPRGFSRPLALSVEERRADMEC